MRTIIALILVLALITPASAQWSDRRETTRWDRWQQEEEIRQQERELQRQRQEMDYLQDRLRDAEAERDRLQMEQHDLERERGIR